MSPKKISVTQTDVKCDIEVIKKENTELNPKEMIIESRLENFKLSK